MTEVSSACGVPKWHLRAYDEDRKVMKPVGELNRTAVLVLYWGLFGGGGTGVG